MSTLIQFIEALAINPELQQDFRNDPTATMQSYGLQNLEIKAILSGNKAQVEQLAGNTILPVTFVFPAQ
jgi:hypothetical protein